jgi:outer membrane protein
MGRQSAKLSPLLALYALGILPVSSQAAQLISFNDAIRIALERNVDLRQARTNAQISEVVVSQARMRFAPNLSINSSAARNFGHYYSSLIGTFVDQTTNTVDLGASSAVNLFSGFHDVNALRQSKLSSRASQLDSRRAEETAIFSTISNFLDLILKREQLQVQRENLAAEVQLEERIGTYVKAGARASSDLYQQQANVASARLNVIQAQNATDISAVNLLGTLQLDPTQTYDVQTPDVESIFSADATDFPYLVTQALNHRTDLQAEEARVAALERATHVASSGYWPIVSLSAGYGTSYDNALSKGFHDQLETDRNGSVALNVSIPLFDNGVTRSAIRRARLDLQNARITLDSERNNVELQVKSAYLNYRSAREALNAAQAEQHAAQLAVESAQERFRAGTAILVEVTQQRQSYMLARSALATSRYNLALQSTMLKYYVGQIQSTTMEQDAK